MLLHMTQKKEGGIYEAFSFFSISHLLRAGAYGSFFGNEKPVFEKLVICSLRYVKLTTVLKRNLIRFLCVPMY